MAQFKVGQKVYVSKSANPFWFGEGQVTSITPNGKVMIAFSTGASAGRAGSFPAESVVSLEPVEEAAAPEEVIRLQLVQPPAKYQNSLPKNLTLDYNMNNLAHAWDEFNTGGEQSQRKLLSAMALTILAMAIERS